MAQELAWERIGKQVLGFAPKRPMRYTLQEGEADAYCPFYINYGFLAAPPKLLGELFDLITDLHSQTYDLIGNDFYGQVAIALAVEKNNLPYRALPMRFNFPNDRNADRLYPEELDQIILIHYLRYNLFDRHRIFNERKAFTQFLSGNLVGSDLVFQNHVQRVTRGESLFSGNADTHR